MFPKRVGNIIAVVGFIVLSIPQAILLLGAMNPLTNYPILGLVLFFGLPAAFTFALAPVLRRINADYALAAGTSTVAMLLTLRLLLNTVISAFDDAKAAALARSLQLLGPLAAFLTILLVFRSFSRISKKAVFLIPAGVLTAFVAELAAQQIINLVF